MERMGKGEKNRQYNTHSEGSVANSSSSVSGSASGPTSARAGVNTSLLNRIASSSARPQHTKLPLLKINTSPSRFTSPPPSPPLQLLLLHFGTQYASCSGRALGGSRVRRRVRRYRSEVATVEMGCILLWVGLGFARIGRESEAVRRSGVCALGFRDPCGGRADEDDEEDDWEA
jgi:hypothetical protein